jgi:uncharacterized protein YciI
MTAEERELMQAHAEHWKASMAKGHIIAFGVVGDPAGAFGVGIVQFEDEKAVRAFTDSDPVIASNRGFRYDILPMPFGVQRP